jgi:signal transduction histidine kinase
MSTVLALTEQLSAASTREDIAAIVAESTVAQLGASAGFVAVVSQDGAALEMLSHVREGEPDMPNCRLELDQRLPVIDAWRFAVPIFLGTSAELYHRYPGMDRARTDREAVASIPLEVDGACLGAIHFTFAQAQTFDACHQAVLRAVAALCAQCLRRAMLADDLDQVRTEFAVTASHELRTPLAAIYGAAVTLTDDGVDIAPSDQVALLDMICAQAERMTAIVDDLRLTALLDGELLTYDVAAVDTRAVVDAAVVFWRADERLTLRVDQPEPSALADPVRLQQVIANLVDNAHKYDRDGGVVEIDVTRDDGDVVISVRDHGPGIPPGIRQRVADKFFRGDAHHRNGVTGTGLGLYISRRLILGMGGTLTLGEPEFGAGTVATVRLPAAQD